MCYLWVKEINLFMINDLNKTIIAFTKLGDFLNDFLQSRSIQGDWAQRLGETIELSGHQNGWFTKENVKYAVKSWASLLTYQNLNKWLINYDLENRSKKTVAIIMAGNIPLVGFHDFLCVLLTGNKALVKLSDSDKVLLPFLCDFLVAIEPSLKESIEFKNGKLEQFDAVIATGSNNTARYFEYYFGNKPNIIRKNRNSIAVLTGNESKAKLEFLGEDIFRYYGLGCRSVSKLFVPEGYDFDTFFKSIFSFNEIVNQNKYANNYDYNKAVYLMSDFPILDNGFLILKEDTNYASPIASLNYEFYTSEEELKNRLEADQNELQCIVSEGFWPAEVPFGHTQIPSLEDYADGVDTVDFLLKK